MLPLFGRSRDFNFDENLIFDSSVCYEVVEWDLLDFTTYIKPKANLLILHI